MSFPCVDANELRAQRLAREKGAITFGRPPKASPTANATARRQGASSSSPAESSSTSSSTSTTQTVVAAEEEADVDNSGPEPAYSKVVSGYKTYHHAAPLELDYGGVLPQFDIAYETWGELNPAKDNVILIHTGLSASSHAHSTPENPAEGWWEKFIGPNKAIDTNRFFVICTNVLGGCYGSTGPSSLDPSDGKPYATRFPILSIFDMVRAQFLLLDSLGVDKLYASVGSSMGGMQSVAAGHLEPERVGKVVSISGSARSSPSSIALRYAQRSVLMADPNWNRGFYYDGLPPHTGMKLARQIATITYRSGPEWEQRFGRRRRTPLPASAFASPSTDSSPSDAAYTPPVLCPDFLIETYLDHQGESFCLKYDANSLIYISKAMDLFDMSAESLREIEVGRQYREQQAASGVASSSNPMDKLAACYPASDAKPLEKQHSKPTHISSLPSSLAAHFSDLAEGLKNLSSTPTLVIGVQSDALFPFVQQREIAEALRVNGNKQVVYYELDSPMGHDSFLLDVANVTAALKGFL